VMLMTILQFDGWFSDGFSSSEVSRYHVSTREILPLWARLMSVAGQTRPSDRDSAWSVHPFIADMR
jgi:hypothetical protein